MKLTVLGSGTSHGIPVVGCSCPVCRSRDEHDRRYRASLYVRGDAGERIVVDTGPEFRLQAVRAGITRLDALLLTHAHADHLHGLDDVRPLTGGRPLPLYSAAGTLAEIKERFPYIFNSVPQEGGGRPKLELVEASGRFTIGSLVITPVPVRHGVLTILGWKFEEVSGGGERKSAAYITDVNGVPEESAALVRDCDTLIIGSLRESPHATHFSFSEALEFAGSTGARRVWLTHICHNHGHEQITAYCRERPRAGQTREAAYDMLEINV